MAKKIKKRPIKKTTALRSLAGRVRAPLTALLIVGSVVVVGAYIVIRSNAQSTVPDNAIVVYGSGNTLIPEGANINTDTTYNPADNTVTYNSKVDFQKTAVPLYIYAPVGVWLTADDRRYNYPRQVDDWHIAVGIQMYVDVVDVVCASGYVCQIERDSYSAGDGGRVDKVSIMEICINLSRQDFNKAFKLLTFNVNPSTAVRRPSGPEWTVQTTAERNRCVPTADLSTTDRNLSYNRGYDWHTYALPTGIATNTTSSPQGAWGQNGTPPGQAGNGTGGTGTGNGGTGTGTNGIGSGTGKTGGTGAKGGGSANQQSNQPNPVPSDSAQGTTQAKPGQTPSPFYDGKQYAAGSDSESRQNVASSIAGQAADSWPYIVPAVVLLGAGGVLYWRLRKRK